MFRLIYLVGAIALYRWKQNCTISGIHESGEWPSLYFNFFGECQMLASKCTFGYES